MICRKQKVVTMNFFGLFFLSGFVLVSFFTFDVKASHIIEGGDTSNFFSLDDLPDWSRGKSVKESIDKEKVAEHVTDKEKAVEHVIDKKKAASKSADLTRSYEKGELVYDSERGTYYYAQEVK